MFSGRSVRAIARSGLIMRGKVVCKICNDIVGMALICSSMMAGELDSMSLTSCIALRQSLLRANRSSVPRHS